MTNDAQVTRPRHEDVTEMMHSRLEDVTFSAAQSARSALMADLGDVTFARSKRFERMRRLVDAVKLGANISEACAYVGISRPTWYRWKERGDRGEPPYAGLLDKICAAALEADNTALRDAILEMTPEGA